MMWLTPLLFPGTVVDISAIWHFHIHLVFLVQSASTPNKKLDKMGVYSTLYNFTKKQKLCVGKSGEEPVIATLHLLSQKFGWDLVNDKIEMFDSCNAPEWLQAWEDKRIMEDLHDKISWQERSALWKGYDIPIIPPAPQSEDEEEGEDE